MYIRYHVHYTSPKTNQPVGIFVAVWHLLEKGQLTNEEVEAYWKIRVYAESVLPVPPFYANGNPQGAVTWFKDTPLTLTLLEKFQFYFDILDKYQVTIQMKHSENPGEIIYEDDFQVGVLVK